MKGGKHQRWNQGCYIFIRRALQCKPFGRWNWQRFGASQNKDWQIKMRMGSVGEKKKYGVFPFFSALLPRACAFSLCFSIGSLGNNDGDGYENVTWILKSHCFRLYRTYSTSDSSNVGNFFWIWFLQNIFQSSGKEKESRCLVFTSFTKREIKHFHAVVVQSLQRNVQKSVMHVQSCCFANLNLLLFCRSRWRRRRRCLSSL